MVANMLGWLDNPPPTHNIELHPARCLNTRFRAVNCTRCADACPAAGAITVTNGHPTLAADACVQCGLCLHYCPTNAFIRPDNLSGKLIQSVATLPAGPVDVLCSRHPCPDIGPSPQAVQTRHCLAALSPAVLLELAQAGHNIWLDDNHCSACPLGRVHAALGETVAEANGWASLLPDAGTIRLQGSGDLKAGLSARPVVQAEQPPVSRRGLLGAVKRMARESVPPPPAPALVQGGKTVPVSARLPQSIPLGRSRVLALLEAAPQDSPVTPHSAAALPLADIKIDSQRCTACGLCARFCPTGALKFLSDDNEFALTFQPGLCLGRACSICALACPEQAVALNPVALSPTVLLKRPLAAGSLTRCVKCAEPMAPMANRPNLCYACRTQNDSDDLFPPLPRL